MADTIRDKIIDNILAALPGITIANGFNNDIGVISDGLVNPLGLPKYPAALILPDSEDPEAGASDVSRRELTVTLRLWVGAHQTIRKKLGGFIGDVEKKIFEDRRRGGNAVNTIEGPISYIYLQRDQVEAGADVDFIIHYRTKIGDPTALP